MNNILTQKKVISLFILAATLIFVSSCGNKETKNLIEDKTEAETEDPSVSEELEDEVDPRQEEKTPEVIPEADSNQIVAVRYGEEFLDYDLGVSGDMLYMCGSTPEENGIYLAGMPGEEQQLSWSYIEIPDQMEIRNIVTDYQNKWHILLMEMAKVTIDGLEHNLPTYEVSYIWTINREGEVERKLDVSDIFAREQRSPSCFITDSDGNFYFDEEGDILRLDPDSSVTMRWSCNSDRIEAIGCGKSGKIYCIYEDHQGADILELLEEDGIADICLPLPKYDCKYCCMAAGIDAELLIFNRIGGVFAYTAEDNVVKQRIWEKDMPVSGQDVFADKFLNDGRLFLKAKDRGTDECLYYYMPTAIGGENE